LRDNPDVAGKIEQAIRQNAGLIADKIVAASDSDAETPEAADVMSG